MGVRLADMGFQPQVALALLSPLDYLSDELLYYYC